jgi:hypothetical protein
MRSRLVRPALAAVLAAATLVPAGATQADGGGGGPNNLVLASTTGTGVTEERARTRIGSYGGDSLQSANVARARSADCTDCRTVAVAVQAVFATGNPRTVEPKNLAVATNENCQRCTTFAYAYQYVVTTDGPVKLSRAARRELAGIRARIADTARSGLPPAELDARLDELTAEFKATIDSYLERAGEEPEGRVREDDDTDFPDAG